jgi:hypothetical protein
MAALASCSDDSSPEADPGLPDTSAPTETGDIPETETPVDNPSISLPSLPIGGNTTESADPDVPNNQCVDVNWIVDEGSGATLKEGIQVVVTSAIFTPDLFDEADTGCDDSNPSCIGYEFTEDAQACTLAVKPLEGAELLDENPFVALGGIVNCQLDAEECQAFADAVATEQNLSIDLLIPEVSPTDDTTSG